MQIQPKRALTSFSIQIVWYAHRMLKRTNSQENMICHVKMPKMKEKKNISVVVIFLLFSRIPFFLLEENRRRNNLLHTSWDRMSSKQIIWHIAQIFFDWIFIFFVDQRSYCVCVFFRLFKVWPIRNDTSHTRIRIIISHINSNVIEANAREE